MNMRQRLIAGIIVGVCASGLGLGTISAHAATAIPTAATSTATASTPDWGGWHRHHCHRWGWQRHCDFDGGGDDGDGGDDG